MGKDSRKGGHIEAIIAFKMDVSARHVSRAMSSGETKRTFVAVPLTTAKRESVSRSVPDLFSTAKLT